MNLLFLNWRDTSHPKAGGAEQLTENIAAEMVKRGHKVTLLCPVFPGCQLEETKRGYYVIRRGNQLTVRFYAWKLWQKMAVSSPLNKGELEGVKQKTICIDQVHGLPFFTALYVSNKQSLTIIYEVAGDLWRQNFAWPVSGLGKIMETIFLRLYQRRHLVTICQSTKDELTAAGIPDQNVSIIPVHINFKPLSSPTFNKPRPILIHLGRIAPVKNVEAVIAAAVQLRKSIPDLQLWLVGSGQGKYFKHVQTLTIKHKDFITMHGFVSEEKKQELLSKAKVLIAASHKEGYGLNVLEAAACGTPSVAYNVGGLREAIVDGKTGLLTSQNTPEYLVRQLKKLLTNDHLYQTLTRQAWQRSHDFSPHKTADEFEKIITKKIPEKSA